MSAAAVAALLDDTGWTDREAARQFGCDKGIIARWRYGTAAPPPEIAAWLASHALWHLRNPAPVDWQRQGVRRIQAG